MCTAAFSAEIDGGERLVVLQEFERHERDRIPEFRRRIQQAVTEKHDIHVYAMALLSLGSIPKTSSGKLRREETKQLYLAGTLTAGRAPAWVQIVRLGTSSGVHNFSRAILAGLQRGLEMLYGIYFFVVFGLWIVPTWAILHLLKDHRTAGRYTSSALKILFALIGCRVRVTGMEYVDAPGAKIFTSNHTSYFDVLPLMLGLGVPYRFVAKLEVHGMPFIGAFLDRMGHLRFDRTSSESRLGQVREVEELLHKGESIFIFPEGTFTSEDGVRPFQLGAFKASVATGVPLLPISLAGTRRVLRDGTYLPRPSSVTITVHPPIYPRAVANDGSGSDTSEWQELIRLRDATREAIVKDAGEPLL